MYILISTVTLVAFILGVCMTLQGLACKDNFGVILGAIFMVLSGLAMAIH